MCAISNIRAYQGQNDQRGTICSFSNIRPYQLSVKKLITFFSGTSERWCCTKKFRIAVRNTQFDGKNILRMTFLSDLGATKVNTYVESPQRCCILCVINSDIHDRFLNGILHQIRFYALIIRPNPFHPVISVTWKTASVCI